MENVNYKIKWFNKETGQIGIQYVDHPNIGLTVIDLPLDKDGNYDLGDELTFLINVSFPWHFIERQEKIKAGIGNEDDIFTLVDNTVQDAPAIELTWDDIRKQRDQKLYMSDWTQLPDNGLDAIIRYQWQTYRQTLRSIPEMFDNPADVVWPTEPK